MLAPTILIPPYQMGRVLSHSPTFHWRKVTVGSCDHTQQIQVPQQQGKAVKGVKRGLPERSGCRNQRAAWMNKLKTGSPRNLRIKAQDGKG